MKQKDELIPIGHFNKGDVIELRRGVAVVIANHHDGVIIEIDGKQENHCQWCQCVKRLLTPGPKSKREIVEDKVRRLRLNE